ncbi:MAG: siderophore-interacting protein [Actinomyces sp.]|nr:siderophore-interacting protein [Actinomyces sp.]MCI1662638.1 siderophore-interacting protein [Actinomyces sp.]
MTRSPSLVRRKVRHELRRRSVTVTATRRLTPGMVRVTVAGRDLADFQAPGPADHLKLILPGADDEPVLRDYTPSAFRSAPGGPDSPVEPDSPAVQGLPELDIDFVLHGDEGPASAWARRAAPGDRVELGGPRGSFLLEQAGASAVLIADETGFPAVARMVAALPPDVAVTALLAPLDPANAAYFDGADVRGADLRWFTGASRAEDLGIAVRAVPQRPGTWFFLAGETGLLIPLRRHLRHERGLPASQVVAQGYWKHGVVALDHHAPLDPQDPD